LLENKGQKNLKSLEVELLRPPPGPAWVASSIAPYFYPKFPIHALGLKFL